MKSALAWLACLALLAPMTTYAKASRDDAASAAQRATGGGRVLSVEKTDRDGHQVWRVKVVTAQGEVRIVLVDVESGKAL